MRRVLTLAIAGSVMTGAAMAQSPEAFFKDKTIRIVVGHSPGGSYDFYARLAADMLKAQIPGLRAAIVENKPGAGGLVATNWFYSQAPKDGTHLGLLPETIANTQLLEPGNSNWDVRQLRYIGSFASVNTAIMRRSNSPAKTLDVMKKMESVVGCTGVNAQSYQFPALLKTLGGYNFRMVCGYPGAKEYSLALERGEIDMVSSAWNSWRVTHRGQIDRGELVAVVQTGLKRNPELADIPLMQELVDDPVSKRAIEFASAGAAIGRALVAPPGLPADRVDYLRAVFDKAVKDPEMIEMAAKRNLILDPTPGAEVQVVSDAIVDTPPEVIKRAAEAFKG